MRKTMAKKTASPYSENVLESGFSTVTSGGHWFRFTSRVVREAVPELLERHSYEKIVLDAVAWIRSTDSLSLLLYFLLVFWFPAWIAAGLTLTFYFAWYNFKAAFVRKSLTPLMKALNHDATQLIVAAIFLSLLGMSGHYMHLLFGILFFFLFKVGLLRLLLQRVDGMKTQRHVTLNDQVMKSMLLRYAARDNLALSGDTLEQLLQKNWEKARSGRKQKST